jgi:hypothetical protein
MIPSLEGSTHINYGLTAQFIGPYFADAAGDVQEPSSLTVPAIDASENPYWLAGRDRNARTVRFADFRMAYGPLQALANVRLFVKQLEAFHVFLSAMAALPRRQEGATRHRQAELDDTARSIALGKCLAAIAYGQLIAENCRIAEVASATASVIFHVVIEDFSAQVLALAALFDAGSALRSYLNAAVCVVETNAADLESVAKWIAARYRMENDGVIGTKADGRGPLQPTAATQSYGGAHVDDF